MTAPSQGAPPEAFVSALATYYGGHVSSAEVNASWHDGSMGVFWRAAQAAAYEEAARIAETHAMGTTMDATSQHDGRDRRYKTAKQIAAAIRERAGRKE